MKTYTRTETENEVTLNPLEPPRSAVIWLHGLGADGNDFVPIVPELRVDALAVRFVFPHAPVRPITMNMGMEMRGWYDIPEIRNLENEDEAGTRESEQILRGYIQKEIDGGLPPERIVIAGFSQGGAIVLHTGLRYEHRLAGMMALSTYLPLSTKLEGEARPERKDTPILQCHGEFDPMLPIQMGELAREVLVERGYEVEWYQYPMQHQVCLEEIEQIADWLRARLA